MPGTPAPRTSGSFQRRLKTTLTERLGLKVIALFVAVVVWFVVNAKEPQIELVTVRFAPVLLDSSLVLRDPPPQLQAIVAGAPKDLIKLTSNMPVIRRQIAADTPDTLVMDLRPEDVMLPDGIDAVVRDVQPRSLTLRFESTWTRTVPIVATAIDVSRAPRGGYARAELEPNTVEISGPRHLVVKIASVRTAKIRIPFPDSMTHLVDIDTTALGSSVHARPTQVKVHLLKSPPSSTPHA